MGSTKVKTVDQAVDPDKTKDKEEKAKVDIQEKIDAKIEENKAEGKDQPTPMRKARSAAYIAARRHVDRTKYYPLKKAVELVKKTFYAKFTGTIVADLTTRQNKVAVEVEFPHNTGKDLKVAIADQETLKQIEQGDINFDVLLAKPDQMKDIAKHARVLGPQGLMPNPKTNTITDDPEKRKKELESGKRTIRTERKAPLMHVTVGKTDQKDKEVIENIEAVITKIGPKSIKKLTLAATMSPGIKVDLSEFQTGR